MVEEALLAAVADVNEQLPKERRLAASPDAILCGDGSVLDSLGLLNFMLAAEQRLEDAGFAVNLTALPNAADPSGPLRSIATLARYVNSSGVRSNEVRS
jgi:hypothetical protein